MISSGFGRFAGSSGILAGVVGFLYSVAFIVLNNALLSGLFLLIGGLLATAALTGVYHRVRTIEASLALWGYTLAIAGALGSAIHGGYDLANAINPPAGLPTDLPSAIDPRGLLTFGVSAVGLFAISWLIGQGRVFAKGLSYLGYVLAALSVILYVGRLIVLSPRNPLIFVPALLAGFVAYPIWYVWIGLSLRKAGETPGA